MASDSVISPGVTGTGSGAAPGTTALWAGAYPADGPGGQVDSGEGIWRLALDPATGTLTGALAVACPAPSFVATSPDGRWLYAVGEDTAGTVGVFAVDPDGALVPSGRVSSGGEHPCHVVVHPEGLALYVTNYGDGTVAVLTLTDGALSAEVLAAGGPVQLFTPPERHRPGPVVDRQEGAHAHSATLAPGGRHLLVADLGADTLRGFRLQPDGTLVEDGVAADLPPGTGPRHLAVGPGDHLYVTGELSVTVHVLAWDAATGTAAPVATVPAGRTPTTPGTPLLPAHVVADDGQVLVSVRGADVLASYAVHDGGARLDHVGDTPVGGAAPRHFAVLPGTDGAWVVSAVQDAGLVTVLRHGAAGPAGDVVEAFALPYVACIVPA